MKVVLIQHVQNIGRRGEVKEVKDGFALNYLLPKKLAVQATPKNISKYRRVVEDEQVAKAKRQEEPKKIIQKLKSFVLTFTEKTDDKGTFFAGVTKDKIAKALVEKGVDVKAKHIQLAESIKKEGEYSVKIEISSGQMGEIKVITKAA